VRAGGTGVAVDAAGNAYVTGGGNVPTTPGAFQTSPRNMFVAKFNPCASGTASLVYSTYLGGSGRDGTGFDENVLIDGAQKAGPAIAIDGSGDAYLTGYTTSQDFPTTPGAYQTQNHSPQTGTPFTSIGDAFITKLNATGTGLVYSTYLGGSVNDGAAGIAVDANGDADVTGWTWSSDFPTRRSLQATNAGGADAFVATLDPSGSRLLFSTYLGGSGNDWGYPIALDPAGNAYVAGRTGSTNFPTTPGAVQTTAGGGFVFKIAAPAGPALTVTAFPLAPTAGTAGTFTVAAQDANGNTLTGYTGTVHFSSSDPQAVLPLDYTFTAADQGVHNFSATFKTAGSQSLVATDTVTAGMSGQEGVQVNPAAATHFVISAPSSVTAGTAFTITVTAVDPYGNVATGYRGTVHFTSSDSRPDCRTTIPSRPGTTASTPLPA
jgi:hypothetical protein